MDVIVNISMNRFLSSILPTECIERQGMALSIHGWLSNRQSYSKILLKMSSHEVFRNRDEERIDPDGGTETNEEEDQETKDTESTRYHWIT